MQTESWTPTATSGTAHCLIYGSATVADADGTGSTTQWVSYKITVDGTTYGGEIERMINAGAENNPMTGVHFVYAGGIATGGALDVKLEMKSQSNTNMKVSQGHLLVIDLGQDAP
jgi:hypothetical protein